MTYYTQSKYNKEGELESILSIHERMLRRPGHPNAGKGGSLTESRLTAANALGHPLPQGAVVHHHRDGTLVLCQDKSYHRLLHARMNALDATGDPHKRRCKYCRQWDDLINLQKSCPTGGFHHRNCAIEYQRQLRRAKKDGTSLGDKKEG